MGKFRQKELNKCLQKFYLSARKAMTIAVRSLHTKIVIVAGNSKWIKIIIFVLNYLTVLVYTKTIIHLSIGGYCLQFGTTSKFPCSTQELVWFFLAFKLNHLIKFNRFWYTKWSIRYTTCKLHCMYLKIFFVEAVV